MKKEIRKDIFGNIPQIGDIIVYNIPYYKGLCYGECVAFSNSGLPEIKPKDNKYMGRANNNGNITPKTRFVIYRNN